MQDSKRVLRDFFNWLSNIKNFVLSNGSENVRNVIRIALKSHFFPKNRPAAGNSVTCLSCTNLLATFPNFDRIEKFLTCGSSPSSTANPGYEPNQMPSF